KNTRNIRANTESAGQKYAPRIDRKRRWKPCSARIVSTRSNFSRKRNTAIRSERSKARTTKLRDTTVPRLTALCSLEVQNSARCALEESGRSLTYTLQVEPQVPAVSQHSELSTQNFAEPLWRSPQRLSVRHRRFNTKASARTVPAEDLV